MWLWKRSEVDPIEVLKFIGLPLLTTSIICLVSCFLFKKDNKVRELIPIVAIGVSSFIAFWLQEGLPSIPATQKWHYLIFIIGALATINVLVYSKFNNTLIIVWLAAFGLVQTLLPILPGLNDLATRFLLLVFVIALPCALKGNLRSNLFEYIVCWLIFGGYSVLAIQSGFAKLAFFSASLSAISAALGILSYLLRIESRFVPILLGTSMLSILMCGKAYDQVHEAMYIWYLPAIGICIPSIALTFVKPSKFKIMFSLFMAIIFVIGTVVWSLSTVTNFDDYAKLNDLSFSEGLFFALKYFV